MHNKSDRNSYKFSQFPTHGLSELNQDEDRNTMRNTGGFKPLDKTEDINEEQILEKIETEKLEKLAI